MLKISRFMTLSPAPQRWLHMSSDLKDRYLLDKAFQYKTLRIVMYGNRTDYVVSQCLCYCQSFPLVWTNALGLLHGACIIKLITAVIYGFRNKLKCLSLNTKLGWKAFPGTNTLAYYRNHTVLISFMIQALIYKLRICNVLQCMPQ